MTITHLSQLDPNGIYMSLPKENPSALFVSLIWILLWVLSLKKTFSQS